MSKGKDTKLKKYKPVTSTQRHTVLVDTQKTVTRDKPEKKLTAGKAKVTGRKGGRKITVRHRGGGVKRKYRDIDFKRSKRDVKAVVKEIEYDPNRTCYIALLHFEDGDKTYIIAPKGLKEGQTVVAGDSVEPEVGNAMQLKSIPAGTEVHNVELTPGSGGKMARSAGAAVVLQGVEDEYAQLKMPSGEIRLVPAACYATIGVVSNPEHALEKLGKAGRKRHKGFRPTVRGMAMYGQAHPHGGGEARGVVGGPAKDPWGHLKGTKTRRRKNKSDRLILVRRKGKKLKK